MCPCAAASIHQETPAALSTGSFSVPRCALGSVNRHAGAVVKCVADVVLRGHVALRRRLSEPFNGHSLVHVDTATLVVGDAHSILRFVETLFRRLAEPYRTLHRVHLHTIPIVVRTTNVELRTRVALHGGLFVPHHALCLVDAQSVASGVECEAKAILRICIALLNRLAVPAARRNVAHLPLDVSQWFHS